MPGRTYRTAWVNQRAAGADAGSGRAKAPRASRLTARPRPANRESLIPAHPAPRVVTPRSRRQPGSRARRQARDSSSRMAPATVPSGGRRSSASATVSARRRIRETRRAARPMAAATGTVPATAIRISSAITASSSARAAEASSSSADLAALWARWTIAIAL